MEDDDYAIAHEFAKTARRLERLETMLLPDQTTLRDRMAMAALTGFCQHQGWIGYIEHPEHREHLFSNYARDAYAFADAMLRAREAK